MPGLASSASGDRQLRWQVAAAAVRGIGHVQSNQPCQDAVRYRTYRMSGTPPDTLVTAVADGAGSAPCSDLGASLAATASIGCITERLRENPNGAGEEVLERVLIESVCVARQRLAEAAEQQGRNIHEYDTTLLLAIQAGGTLAVAQIGDGAIIAGDGDNGYRCITSPDRGEYANETNFITRRNALSVCQFQVMTDLHPQHIAMFTDGIQKLALDYRNGEAPYAPFFRSTFDWLAQQTNELEAYTGLRQFLRSSRIRERTYDDVTLLLARRRSGL